MQSTDAVPFVLRQVTSRLPCGCWYRRWMVFSGDVAVASVDNPTDFVSAWILAHGAPLVIE